MNKLILVLAAALLLGGCTIGSKMMGQSATDMSSPTPTSSPVSSTLPDSELDSIPSTTTSSDTSSIESDLNATVILEEDFSDLE